MHGVAAIFFNANESIHFFFISGETVPVKADFNHTWRRNQSYINADLKICLYLRLHIKVICRRFDVIAPFTF